MAELQQQRQQEQGEMGELKVLTQARVRALLEMADKAPSAVKELRLDSLEADKLAPAALDGLPALRKLHLQKNKLEDLPRAVVGKESKRADSSITYLDLGDNKLAVSAVEKLAKWRLASLVTLKLNGNGLVELPPAVLAALPRLCALVLNDNALKTIRFECDMPLLNTLVVSGNQIEDLGPAVGFKHLPGLKKLSASKNALTQLPALCDSCPLVAELRLSRNKISDLRGDGKGLVGLTKLAVLDVSNNALDRVEKLEPLKGCSTLIHVSFTNNPFQSALAHSDKAAYGKALEPYLHSAARLKTVDSSPVSAFDLSLAEAPARKRRPVRGTVLPEGHPGLNQGKSGNKSTPDGKRDGKPDGKRDDKPDGKRDGKPRSRNSKPAPSARPEPGKSKEENAEAKPAATKEAEVAKPKATAKAKDVVPAEPREAPKPAPVAQPGEAAAARSGVEAVIEAAPSRKRAASRDKKEKKKKSKKSKTSKSGDAKPAWAVSRQVDAW